MTDIVPTLVRPPEKAIRAFRPRMIEDHTIGALIDKGWSLGICCKDCPRVVEWTPPELERRFADRRKLKLAELFPRLASSGSDGCGSKDVAIFPYRQEFEAATPVRPDPDGLFPPPP